MITEEIKSLAESLLDGEPIDETLFDSLVTAEKDEIEGMREWEFLKKVDESKTVGLNLALPDDFRNPLMVFVGSNTQPHLQIPKEQKDLFTDFRWYLDMQANTFSVLGGSGLVHFHYLYQTDDLTVAAANSPVWPARFHKILAYRVAEKMYPAMQEERSLSWDDKMKQYGDVLLRSMIDWDVNLKKRAVENGVSIADLNGDV